ncbi:MAG TPA: hypothetical protein VN025_09635 [Candidatus Dormibacteraeota bacterium]|jgi:hypothetical protein|nr:hypothetical protein [Candidatus Dormibacteraeota bacterium]
MRREKKRKVKWVRLRTQRDVLRDVMLSANECGAWLTLAELAAMTRYPAASISAQLRHLKKPQFGNYELEKRMRDGADVYSGNAHGVVWEYRLTRRRRVVQAARKERAKNRLKPVPQDSTVSMAVC